MTTPTLRELDILVVGRKVYTQSMVDPLGRLELIALREGNTRECNFLRGRIAPEGQMPAQTWRELRLRRSWDQYICALLSKRNAEDREKRQALLEDGRTHGDFFVRAAKQVLAPELFRELNQMAKETQKAALLAAELEEED